MPQIRPITDLRNTNEISELCHARREPVFITKNGYGDLVIMSMETYEALTAPPPASLLMSAMSSSSLPSILLTSWTRGRSSMTYSPTS